MPPSHLIRPRTNLMVAFLLIDIIGMSVHHSHFSAWHSLSSVIKTKASSCGTGRIFDRLKNLTGDLFSRCSHVPTNQVEFIFFLSEVLPVELAKVFLKRVLRTLANLLLFISLELWEVDTSHQRWDSWDRRFSSCYGLWLVNGCLRNLWPIKT